MDGSKGLAGALTAQTVFNETQQPQVGARTGQCGDQWGLLALRRTRWGGSWGQRACLQYVGGFSLRMETIFDTRRSDALTLRGSRH